MYRLRRMKHSLMTTAHQIDMRAWSLYWYCARCDFRMGKTNKVLLQPSRIASTGLDTLHTRRTLWRHQSQCVLKSSRVKSEGEVGWTCSNVQLFGRRCEFEAFHQSCQTLHSERTFFFCCFTELDSIFRHALHCSCNSTTSAIPRHFLLARSLTR